MIALLSTLILLLGLKATTPDRRQWLQAIGTRSRVSSEKFFPR
jgi:hypothetical protein